MRWDILTVWILFTFEFLVECQVQNRPDRRWIDTTCQMDKPIDRKPAGLNVSVNCVFGRTKKIRLLCNRNTFISRWIKPNPSLTSIDTPSFIAFWNVLQSRCEFVPGQFSSYNLSKYILKYQYLIEIIEHLVYRNEYSPVIINNDWVVLFVYRTCTKSQSHPFCLIPFYVEREK